jgi:hypothetical protein
VSNNNFEAQEALTESQRLHDLIGRIYSGDHEHSGIMEALGALTKATQGVAYAILASKETP